MLSKLLSFSLNGLDGYLVSVETYVHNGLPKVDIVGLADTAVKEAKDRVKSAIKNSLFDFPVSTVTINLAPADMKKVGPIFDLPIAIGILAASKQVASTAIEGYIFVGELSLDGGVRKINGLLPILISARAQGYKKFIIPAGNEKEASFISGIDVFPVDCLADAVDFLKGDLRIVKVEPKEFEVEKVKARAGLDFAFVKGQYSAKRALEIAAAGGHNLIMIGPPGSGKTLLAKCFPSILPDMTFEESLESTKIHSVAGVLDSKDGIIAMRPYRSPHHTATTVSLTGGGAASRPGEISLAHNGVLFLDEMPEYSRQTLEALRQPLEDGQITVSRAAQTVTYPANFTLIASMNPCPCGNFGSSTNECKCTPSQIQHYRSKLSGPLLDRIDLHVEVDSVTYDDLTAEGEAESSQEIKKRVDFARKIQLERFKDEKIFSNSKMNLQMTKKYCFLSEDCQALMKIAFEKLKLSARAHDRILKVARTIADLDGKDEIDSSHIAEAIQYRSLDRKFM